MTPIRAGCAPALPSYFAAEPEQRASPSIVAEQPVLPYASGNHLIVVEGMTIATPYGTAIVLTPGVVDHDALVSWLMCRKMFHAGRVTTAPPACGTALLGVSS